MTEKERLEIIIKTGEKGDIPKPEFNSSKFYRVFGNIIQEYFADRIWEEIQLKKWNPSKSEVMSIGFSIAFEWFNKDFIDKELPFTKDWLKKYLEGRFHGYLEGNTPETDIRKGKKEFEKSSPKIQCQWFLGCPMTDKELKKRGETLQCDHKWPLGNMGVGTKENCMWLCPKHNIIWKGKTLFWGENFIPCGSFLRDGVA